MCTLADFDKIDIRGPWRHWLETELEGWHRDYLPIEFGATVLDVGAGCGETALFYLMHGAGHVIAVEGHESAVRLLQKNFLGDPRVTIVPWAIDKIKVDVEGAEADMDLEVHFPWTWQHMRQTSGVTQMRLLRR